MASIQEQHLAGKIPPVDYGELQLPIEFNEIINKLINKYIDKRFQNSNEFVQSLEFLSEKYLEVPTTLEISEQQVAAFEAEIKEKKGQNSWPIQEASIDTSADMSQGLKFVTRKKLNVGLIILALVAVIIFGKNFFFDASGSDDLLNGFAPTPPEVTGLSNANNIQDENSVASAIAALDSLNALFLTDGTNLSEVEDFPKSNGSDSEEFELKPTKPINEDILQSGSATMNILVRSGNKPIETNIFLDDQFVGNTDKNGHLTLSQLELDKIYAARVSMAGYNSTTKYITLSQETTQVTFDIEPKVNTLGTLILDAIPGADSVFVNDVLFGSKTPFEMKFQQGQHQIRLVNSSLQKSWEQTVELKAGQVLNIKHDFSTIEYGKIAISLKNAFEFGFGYVYVDGKIWPEKHNTTPIEINLEVGSHKIEVRREGFATLPADTAIVVGNNTTQFVSFRLAKEQ